MLSNTKLDIPDRNVYIVHKKKTVWGVNMQRSHGTNETITRILCFNNKRSANLCMNYITEYMRTYSDKVPHNNKLQKPLTPLIPLLHRETNKQIKEKHGIKLFEVQLSDMYKHCKYHNMGLMVCNYFDANIQKIVDGDIGFRLDTEEVIDPLTSWDEQLGRLEECYTTYSDVYIGSS